MHAFVNTRFPAVRRAMGPERAEADDHALDEWLREQFPDSSPDDVENFMRSLQRFARQAAPVAQRALSGAVQGAATGSVAGPYGALAGALIGGTAGALTQPQRPRPASRTRTAAPTPPRATPRQAAPTPSPAPTATPPPATNPAAALPQINPAAAQLLMLLSRPETQQALVALLMNRRSVTTAGQAVPAAAFANALSEFASEAAQLAPTRGRSRFYFDAAGRPRCDLGDDAARARLLFQTLQNSVDCRCRH